MKDQDVKAGTLYRVIIQNQAADEIICYFRDSNGYYKTFGTVKAGTIVMMLKRHGTYREYRVLLGDRVCRIPWYNLEKV